MQIAYSINPNSISSTSFTNDLNTAIAISISRSTSRSDMGSTLLTVRR
jgi:hypothetical protein